MPPVQHRYPREEKKKQKRKKMESFSVKKLSVLYEVSQRSVYKHISFWCVWNKIYSHPLSL